MNRDRILEGITSGGNYLRKQLLSGAYGLSCIGRNGKPKFSNEKGHLFSAFHIVDALRGEINEIERTIFLTRIFSEEYCGQWGYSPRGYNKETGENPFWVDADDTSFTLRTLRSLDVYRANDVLLKYSCTINIEGSEHPAFSTFVSALQQRRLTNAPNFENNFHIHPEVNANVFHTLLDSNHDHLVNEELIRIAQHENGSWASYFYPNEYYSTLQFMSLLKKTGQLKSCFDKGMLFLMRSQNENGSWGTDPDAYLSAMALKALCLNQQPLEEAKKGVHYLMDTMQKDGSWNTKQIIWEFHDNNGDVWRALDNHRVIATAVCVAALKSCLEIAEC
jgi:hypothetical protein